MNIIDIITKKKNKQVLSYEELMYAFNGYLNNKIKDYQMSALLMAITINGMTYEETLDLTDIFIKSGDTLDLSDIKGIINGNEGIIMWSSLALNLLLLVICFVNIKRKRVDYDF